MNWMSKRFLNGLMVVVPLAITYAVVAQLFVFAEKLLGQYLPVQFPGLSLVVVFALIILVGWSSSYWLTRRILALGERVLSSIPGIKFIYGSVKQLSSAVFKSEEMFRQAVLVPYPHAESRAIGFVVAEPSQPIATALPEPYVCVFIPMSLNLASGFNILVPSRSVTNLDVTKESVLQYLLTAGAVMPKASEAASNAS